MGLAKVAITGGRLSSEQWLTGNRPSQGLGDLCQQVTDSHRPVLCNGKIEPHIQMPISYSRDRFRNDVRASCVGTSRISKEFPRYHEVSAGRLTRPIEHSSRSMS